MQIPGVHIETLVNPVLYSYAQVERACAVAGQLARGKFVLCETPPPAPPGFEDQAPE